MSMKHLEYREGDRVQLHPATDDWMRGDKYGRIVAVPGLKSRLYRYSILMDQSGRVRKHAAGNIEGVVTF